MASLLAALRGAAMLRARLHKEIQATALPGDGKEPERDISPLVFVSRGGELLKRTRQGILHWKLVTVYINSSFQVVRTEQRFRADTKDTLDRSMDADADRT